MLAKRFVSAKNTSEKKKTFGGTSEKNYIVQKKPKGYPLVSSLLCKHKNFWLSVTV